MQSRIRFQELFSRIRSATPTCPSFNRGAARPTAGASPCSFATWLSWRHPKRRRASASALAEIGRRPRGGQYLDPAPVGRASPPPRQPAQAPRQRQDDLAGLAAPVTDQAQFAAHARTHRTPQGMAGTRPAFQYRATDPPEPATQKIAREGGRMTPADLAKFEP